MSSGADVNVGSKERELHRLLEVLRIKAEIHVLVHFLWFWEHWGETLSSFAPIMK